MITLEELCNIYKYTSLVCFICIIFLIIIVVLLLDKVNKLEKEKLHVIRKQKMQLNSIYGIIGKGYIDTDSVSRKE